jgi:hypothetical protein
MVCTWYRRHDDCSNTGLCHLSRRIGRCRGGSGAGVLITGTLAGQIYGTRAKHAES